MNVLNETDNGIGGGGIKGPIGGKIGGGSIGGGMIGGTIGGTIGPGPTGGLEAYKIKSDKR